VRVPGPRDRMPAQQIAENVSRERVKQQLFIVPLFVYDGLQFADGPHQAGVETHDLVNGSFTRTGPDRGGSVGVRERPSCKDRFGPGLIPATGSAWGRAVRR